MSDQTNSTATSRSQSAVQEPPLKRRRVAKACQNCRSQKSKCDGKPPICSRCAGYGHKCIWIDKKTQLLGQDGSISKGPRSSSAEDTAQLHLAIQSYEKLIRSFRFELSHSTRAAVDLTLSYMRQRLPPGTLGSNGPVSPAPVVDDACQQNASEVQSPSRQRYLGEASDLHFFHTIKNILQEQDLPEGLAENDIQSYDQGTLHLETQGAVNREDLPTKDLADTYFNIYFSTIHIAYPFVNKPAFMQQYEDFWKGDMKVMKSYSWLSLLYTIFAIGAYYTSFPLSRNTEDQVHLRFFGQALSLSSSIMTDCTLENIQMLLAQCFFLLATAQTDRCWNTLGLAIRAAQSIGFHVEDSLKQPATHLPAVEQETMRRTWYSMYVLDRLLALQLGRPMAIHEGDYRVNLPSETEETAFIFDGKPISSREDKTPSGLEYSISVTKFSQILGQVITELYTPAQVALDPNQMMLSTITLDQKLIEWKLKLPRHLRFDLGQTFEKFVIFKRQRNMLAIKFHHLRTLLHRPYLCLAWLQRQNRPLMALLERAHDQVEALEKICVQEAQQTAHLLYNVSDERSLVHDFPWWQMISCLLCASSVLLVSRACIKPEQACAEVCAQALDEDAETCLKVFDALSVNSDAARRARDMMKGLKKTRILPINSSSSWPDLTLANEDADSNVLEMPSMEHITNNTMDGAVHYGPTQNLPEWQIWPGELSDPMAWSAQFIDPSQHLQFSAESDSGSQITFYTQGEGHSS